MTSIISQITSQNSWKSVSKLGEISEKCKTIKFSPIDESNQNLVGKRLELHESFYQNIAEPFSIIYEKDLSVYVKEIKTKIKDKENELENFLRLKGAGQVSEVEWAKINPENLPKTAVLWWAVCGGCLAEKVLIQIEKRKGDIKVLELDEPALGFFTEDCAVADDFNAMSEKIKSSINQNRQLTEEVKREIENRVMP